MDDELLINLVKRNELLYNKFDKDHKSIEKKNAAWKRIASELQVSESDCVRRWSSLRDRYTKESRRMTALANNGMTTTRFWPFFNDLEFLKPFIVARSSRIVGSSSFSIRVKDHPAEFSSQSFISENDDSAAQYEYLSEAFPLKDPTAPSMSDQEILQEEIEALVQSDSMSSSQYEGIDPKKLDKPKLFYKTVSNSSSRQKPNRKRHYDSDTENQLTSALEKFKEMCDETRSRHQNPAVHGFGQMIVETLCSMSERKQAIAMQKVTEIVMNLKMEPEYNN